MARAILAALWDKKGMSRAGLFSHKYVRILAGDKNRSTHRSCLYRLVSSDILKKELDNIFVLTKKGEKQSVFAFIEAELALHQLAHNNEEIRKWDGGWRMVFFDIPEKNRRHRDYLRRVLKLIGFYELQKSIWVYPYPVPAFLKNLILHEDIKSHVRFITTNQIDDDLELREFFGFI